MFNILAASPNNPFALLDIVDCTAYLVEGGKKDASYLATMIMPHIAAMESTLDEANESCKGFMYLVLFDGAANVQKNGMDLGSQIFLHHHCAWCRAFGILIDDGGIGVDTDTNEEDFGSEGIGFRKGQLQ